MNELVAAVSPRGYGRASGADAPFAPRNVEALVGMLSAWRDMQSGRAGSAQRLSWDVALHAREHARGGRGPVVADLPA